MGNLGRSTDDGLAGKPSGPKMSAAEKVINIIMTGMKNYPVFPADHASTGSLLQGVQQAVTRFNDEFGELGFEVTQKQIIYDDKPVYTGEASADNPAYVLYRDGIRWFAFAPGVDEAEITVLCKLFNYYRVIPDEPEDDLVTALWREDLQHIIYEASYELWDSELQADLSSFQPNSPNPPPDRESVATDNSKREKVSPAAADYLSERIVVNPEDQGLWKLTPEEQQYIVRQIKEELGSDSRDAAVRLMFLVLRNEDEAHVYESILTYLKEEFCSSLGGRNFRRAYFILDNVRKIQELLAVKKIWTVPIHNRFRAEITRSTTLQPLVSLWSELPSFPGAEVKNFVAVLQNLPTQAGLTLAAMLGQVDSSHARSLITEIIASYATRDQRVLEVLLIGKDEELAMRMLRVVRDLPDQDGAMQLLGRVMVNAGQRVRVEAGRITGWQNLY